MFQTRRDAGRALAARLASRLPGWGVTETVVLGVARGGVLVADEVARVLGAPLDVIVVQKLRSPADPEFGIGALVAGKHPEVVLDEPAIVDLGVSADYVCEEIERQLRAARLRESVLREGHGSIPLDGRAVVLVDDGIATGGTMRTAIRAVRRAKPLRVVVAAPVASRAALQLLTPVVDAVVCLQVPRRFSAVGASYEEFADVSDGEVIALLAAARTRAATLAMAATR